MIVIEFILSYETVTNPSEGFEQELRCVQECVNTVTLNSVPVSIGYVCICLECSSVNRLANRMVRYTVHGCLNYFFFFFKYKKFIQTVLR